MAFSHNIELRTNDAKARVIDEEYIGDDPFVAVAIQPKELAGKGCITAYFHRNQELVIIDFDPDGELYFTEDELAKL